MRRIIRSVDAPMSPAPAISTRTSSAEENSDHRVSRTPRSSERAPPRTTIVVPQSNKNTLRGMAGAGAKRYWIIAIVTRPPVAARNRTTRS